jgi:hypothetical protein
MVIFVWSIVLNQESTVNNYPLRLNQVTMFSNEVERATFAASDLIAYF